MFKETKEGQTNYCIRCEQEAGNRISGGLEREHTCGMTQKIKTECCEKCKGVIRDENNFGRDYGCLKEDCKCHTPAKVDQDRCCPDCNCDGKKLISPSFCKGKDCPCHDKVEEVDTLQGDWEAEFAEIDNENNPVKTRNFIRQLLSEKDKQISELKKEIEIRDNNII